MLFEKRAKGIYHNTTTVIDAEVLISASIVRCIFPMIRPIMKNFIYTGDLGYKVSKQKHATVGI